MFGIIQKARKLSDRCEIDGLKISIETDKGEVREGKNFRTVMKDPYGYIRGTIGVDLDHLDVFLGPEAQKIRRNDSTGKIDKVWIIHQKLPWTKKYDEDKVMLGYRTKDEAIRAYKKHYDDPDGFMGPVTEMTFDKFKEKIQTHKGKRLGRGKMHKGFGVIKESFGVIIKGGGPFIGPKGGKYADPQHKIPWKDKLSNKNKRKAPEAYKQRAGNIGHLFNHLSQGLKRSDEEQKKNPKHWTHVGSMNETFDKLNNVLKELGEKPHNPERGMSQKGATEAYNHWRGKVDKQMSDIADAIHNHGKDDNKHWGHVGDLHSAEKKLAEATWHHADKKFSSKMEEHYGF